MKGTDEVPYVSIIIPTHNRRDLLKDTIESLFEQSYPKDHCEIIVVDNASVDGTEELVASLQKNAPCKLKYFQKKDEGPGISRNLGIQKAKGSIIAFTEDDCVADNHWLSKGVALMTDGVGLVQGKTLPNPQQTTGDISYTKTAPEYSGLYETFNMLYRKEALDSVGGFSEDFIGLDRFGHPMMVGEDVDLACRVKKLGWRSAFADSAIIYHAVFPFNPWKSIFSFRTIQTFFYTFQKLIKKHPELRKSILYYRYFFSKIQALFDLLIISVFFGLTFHKVFLLLALPFLIFIAQSNFSGQPLRVYPKRFIFASAVFTAHFVIFILLVAGNIRYRTLIL